MSANDFQSIDDEKIDHSIIKRNFIKNYHQSGAIVDAEIHKLSSISVKIIILFK